MKATELRIGNYYDNNGVVSIVSPNTIEEVWVAERSWVKPIPLTEEWLLKFGFEIGYNKTKMLDVYCKDFGILIERSNGGNFYYKKVYISSVHQLQNLYFALTNEELILKEKI